MYANVMAETTGRVLATRLYEATDDPGMKDMLSFLIARDTMHQNQWMAVLEELGGEAAHPIPNSFPQSMENQNVNYSFISPNIAREQAPAARWTSGTSIDGKGTFRYEHAVPMGGIPDLAMADPTVHAQAEQMVGREPYQHKSFIDKAKDIISG